MKHFSLLTPVFVFFLPCTLSAQTGPGGCGNSANNVLWLNGNRGISLSGSLVTQWSDQSGNNNHALPNAAANQPTYVTGAVNSNASLDFDGTDDELRVADHATLDLTQWHLFLVVRPDLQKNYNAWFVKGDDGQENYELLSYSDGNIHAPVYWTSATRTFPSTAGGQVNTTTFEIIEYSFSSPVGRDLWRNNTNIYTDNESTIPSNNALPVYIGNERSTTGRFINGQIAEAIAYNAPVNSAQKIIINNYLAAKYNRTLGTNDIYVQDDPGNGNYDYDAAGIGRNDASNQQTDSRGSGIVRVLNPGNLNDNEYFIFAHNNGLLGTWGSTDLPVGVQGKWFRIWRVSEVNLSGTAVDVGSIELRFDLTGLGPVTASDLRLIVDTDNDNVFADETAIGGATSLGGNIYAFTGITAIGNGMRFTLGTINRAQTPLPVELLDFTAELHHDQVDLNWSTASEKNSAYFTVERSKDGSTWDEVLQVNGAGNSNQLIVYTGTDSHPFEGTSYYRLKQTDSDGAFTYSKVEVVQNDNYKTNISIYPNPTDGRHVRVTFSDADRTGVLVVIRDLQGREYYAQEYRISDSDQVITINLDDQLAAGIYLLTATSGETFISRKMVVKK